MSNKKANNSALMQFAGAGIQMAVIITAFIFLGKYLDAELNNNSSNLYTIIFTLSSIVVALYLFIRKAIILSQKDEK